MVKTPLAMQETQVSPLDGEDPLERGMATHSFQYSCLENSMDRGTWQAAAHELDTTEWLTLSLFFMRSKCVYNFYIPDGLNFKHYEIFLFLLSKNSKIVKMPCCFFFFLNAYLKHLICRPLFFFKISWFPSCIFKFGELEGRQHTGNDFLEVKRALEIKKKKSQYKWSKRSE